MSRKADAGGPIDTALSSLPPSLFFKRLCRNLGLLWVCLVVLPLHAQETSSPVITAENVAHLASIARIDFEGTALDTGWFIMNRTGTRFVSRSATEIYLWSLDDEGHASNAPILETKPAMLTAAAFTADDTLYGVLQGTETRIVKIDAALTPIRTLEGWSLMNLWADDEALWAEAFSNDLNAQEAVLRIPYVVDEAVTALPYAPAEDLEAVVRIGRIAAPYTVTSTETGRVSVWDLPTGKRLYEVNSGSGQAVVFGAMNTLATHLTWRDGASEALYWLDLKSGENQQVERLNGDYVQWFFLTPAADVILGIDKGFSQRVTAWIVGHNMIDLEAYQGCSRPQPDMALLSSDGTTLAIGCDTGIDIWRIRDRS